MTALEAQAAGRPVISYGKGGALETVIPGETGIHFSPQTVDALISAIEEFQEIEWDQHCIRRNALLFDEEVFIKEMRRIVGESWSQFTGSSQELEEALVLQGRT